MDKYYYNL